MMLERHLDGDEWSCLSCGGVQYPRSFRPLPLRRRLHYKGVKL